MSASYQPGRRNSSTQLLDELEQLTQSLYTNPATTNRRTNSLVLPRAAAAVAIPTADEADHTTADDEIKLNPKPRSRRMSLSPWRSRPNEVEQKPKVTAVPPTKKELFKKVEEKAESSERKGLWNWKPIRALSHIGMQKLSCLFSVEVVTVQGLPASMNGLRLAVCVRKKETKDGGVQTMPSRVSHGAADFEETLFIRCHVYCTPAGSGSSHAKFEPRPFLIYVHAVDAEELDFGKSSVDLSLLIQESVEKNFEGTRVKQWDTSFNLSGKAKGGELVLKLGFQIMEKDGGVGIYTTQTEGQKSGKSKLFSPSLGRRQSKTSFSVPSPRMTSRAEAWTPSQTGQGQDFQGLDDLNLDEPAPAPAPVPSTSPSVQRSEEPEAKMEDLDLPDFDVVDKGVEMEDREGTDEAQSEDNSDKRSISSEVVKEIVHDPVQNTRRTELDLIAQQIKALESMMGEEDKAKGDEEVESERLDADEDKVTREFFQMLEDEDGNEFDFKHHEVSDLKLEEDEIKVFLPDLGKGLGCVVQTRNGGYLAAMNPFDVLMGKKDTPKLAMQISKPFVLSSNHFTRGIEIFQQMAAIGLEELSSEILSLMPMEELVGKTAEQIAFEGIASAIISGRNKEGASSTAARAVTVVKSMATAMATGRKERISSGIWNLGEEPLPADEILACSMQKIEDMAVEALKIQAEMAEEEPPFDVSPEKGKNPLSDAIPLDDWMKENSITTNTYNENGEPETITISVVVQLRDPIRQYEAVGGPLIALIHATSEDIKATSNDEEKKFKVASLHIGGLKVRSGGKKNEWDNEKQRLTAIQWLVAYGIGKAGKKGKRVLIKGPDFLWSISSRVMADMWLKPIRNPDVKFAK